MYTAQYVITAIVILAAVFYAGRRIYQIIRHEQDKCYGCKGCDIHDHLLHRQDRISKKPICYSKK